jgi:teichuronic acid biosynthesis glycosyltransferase TuaC
MPVRVAVVAEWYPSPGDPVHGLWAHRQAMAAAAAGAEVHVLALRRPVPPLSLARRLVRWPPALDDVRRWGADTFASLQPFELDGIEVTPVPWLGPPRPISYGGWGYWMTPPLALALSHLMAEWPFDVLHAHCLAPAGHAAALWARRRSPAFVVSAHGPDMFDVPNRGPVGRLACRTSLQAADLVIANSSWAERRCLELAGREVPTTVVHLGADLPPLRPAPSPIKRPLRLVTIAHLQPRKHHTTVLRALARLPADWRPCYLVIGDGEEREPLEQLAAELGIAQDVEFRGQLDNERALAELTDCDLFVMPGVQEPFGVAFVEAMAAGLPAVGGRGEGGPEDIVASGEGMLLVRPGDIDELVALLTRLDGDRAELARLGHSARATVAANFTWERCGENTLAAYEQALATG